MSRTHTLLTGFGPFGSATTNTSQLVVEAIRKLELHGVVGEVLPTSYERGAARLADLVAVHHPTVVLMLGLDQDAKGLKLELVALNLDDAEAPDVDGEIRSRRRIASDAPVAYWTGLDLDAMARTAKRLGEEAVFSHDAGGYVCNHAFFTTAHLAAVSAAGMGVGFVHVPAVAGDELRLSRIVDVVRAWLEDLSA